MSKQKQCGWCRGEIPCAICGTDTKTRTRKQVEAVYDAERNIQFYSEDEPDEQPEDEPEAA